MPHAMQIRQTCGREVLNWTAVDVGEPGSGQVRLRQSRDAFEASANELFEVVASGEVRINVNQRIALKDAAEAHKALKRAQPWAPPF